MIAGKKTIGTIAQKETKGPTAGTEAFPASRIELVLSSVYLRLYEYFVVLQYDVVLYQTAI